MASAKDIIIKPINARTANEKCKKIHYSGKVVPNSQLHFGVFLNGKLEGVMQFGPSINKRGTVNLVEGTGFNEFIELNRMAFSDALPRFSESRAISITLKIIKKRYPQIKWVISFSDGTQCGDGTIYRASGFNLVEIRESDALRKNPKTGEVVHTIQAHHLMITNEWKSWEKTKGYQLKYIYFIDKSYKDRLTVPILPFSKIDEMGAGMYKGERLTIAERKDTIKNKRVNEANSSDQLESGGATPTHTLQS
tara:strand:- start:287 stop:1039 length:753 start_codon:yes stop_codon:yes gene_type:complete